MVKSSSSDFRFWGAMWMGWGWVKPDVW